MRGAGFISAALTAAIGLAAIVGMQSAAAAEDWEPIVVQVRKPPGDVGPAWSPPVPRAKLFPAPKASTREAVPIRPAIPEAVPAARPQRAKRQIAPVPPGTSDIVTGAVGSEPATRHLSPSDAQRLDEAPIVETGATGDSEAAERVKQSDLAQGYCVSIGDAAADARIAWQRALLAATEKKLDERIAKLEAKTAEYKKWLKRRDEFSERATESLVQIYARMEPDSAALQLVAMDEETAAAVLTKLNPRNASAILNDMDPGKAARLTATIAGAARKKQQAERARQQALANNQGNGPQQQRGPQPQATNQGGQTP